jgi:hypothetical protein
MRYTRKYKSVTQTQETEKDQMSYLTEKDFNEVINICKELKETMLREVKEGRKKRVHHREYNKKESKEISEVEKYSN